MGGPPIHTINSAPLFTGAGAGAVFPCRFFFCGGVAGFVLESNSLAAAGGAAGFGGGAAAAAGRFLAAVPA